MDAIIVQLCNSLKDIIESSGVLTYKQVKPGFTNYQPQPKYSWALSKIEGKVRQN